MLRKPPKFDSELLNANAKMVDPELTRLLGCYDRGTMTQFEVLLRIVPIVADSEAARLSLSDDWRGRILDTVREAPDGDENWKSMRIFEMGAWTSQEAYEEHVRRNRLLMLEFRRGVEALRNTMSLDNAKQDGE